MAVVKNQAELDKALAAGDLWIEIRSRAGVCLNVVKSGSSTVNAYGSSTVRAYHSSTVKAYGSSTVRAFDSSTVNAYHSSTVTACDSSTVNAFGSSTVTASAKVAVHLFNANAKVSGGVVIDVTKPLTDAAEWCEYHGVTVSKAGVATLYKAVDDNWTTDRGFDYSPGSKPSAPDWHEDNDCGHGLHFSPTPWQAQHYNDTATKYVEVGVKLADLRPILGGVAKAKAPRVVRACREVDIDGKRVTA